MKNFKKEFWKIHSLLKSNIPFCFIRFSDGEFFILKNKELKLDSGGYTIGESKGQGYYPNEEGKHFLPGRDDFFRGELLNSFKHSQSNYFKGICTRTDLGKEDYDFQISLLDDKSEEFLTFSNLFINSNYELYMNELIPLLKSKNKIAMVMNENCKIDKLPFNVDKVFHVGNNCIINNFGLADEISDFLSDKEGWIVLCSASSLSNIIGYKCFKRNPKNTIIDIGSSLNPLLGLTGWIYSRDYLKHYWIGLKSYYCLREEVW